MNLLFLHKAGGRGGAENALVHTAAALARHASCRMAAAAATPGEMVDKLRALGLPVSLFPMPEWRRWLERPRFAWSVRRIARAYAGERIDVVVSNEFWRAPHAVALARRLGCRSAVILRDGNSTPEKARRYRLHEADRLIPISFRLQEELAADAVLAAKMRVVHDAVSPPPPPGARREQIAALLAERPARRWLLCLGAVGFRKDQISCVRVLKELHRRGLGDCGLLLAGALEPAYEKPLRQAIREAGLEEYVVLAGHVPDIGSLFEACTLSLLTSTQEGCPLSITETLLAGRPAFAYEMAGSLDTLGPVGPFVSERAPAALADRIAAYLNDPAALAPQVEALREQARTRFAEAPHARAFLEALA
ncbi:MAG: glycosyltransferase [Verrucomicrobium sp.]|nr:glycosyltransferase [Verrucomicrobium sp.]